MAHPLPSPVLREFLATLRRGDERSGVVTSIENFGVFVDLDGAPEPSVGFIPPPEGLVEVDLFLRRGRDDGPTGDRVSPGRGRRDARAGCPVPHRPPAEPLAGMGQSGRQRPASRSATS
ncbi:S1 RNA-binding domain-containing protein [Streptomyces avermitilis]|uniref:S1 RNA-binding domain-containing protein n=1 Tax=Streptomyces avermitilis TaxID=33903 RepID=UPI00340B5791